MSRKTIRHISRRVDRLTTKTIALYVHEQNISTVIITDDDWRVYIFASGSDRGEFRRKKVEVKSAVHTYAHTHYTRAKTCSSTERVRYSVESSYNITRVYTRTINISRFEPSTRKFGHKYSQISDRCLSNPLSRIPPTVALFCRFFRKINPFDRQYPLTPRMQRHDRCTRISTFRWTCVSF